MAADATAAAPRPGMPGLRGLEHVGLTVPNLDDAVRFFCDVIGCEHVLDAGTVAGAEMMATRLNCDPTASMRYCFLRCRHGTNLELFEYAAPDQRTAPPRNSDIGGHHLAFYVDAMAPAVAHLRAHGVRILGEPSTIEEGPAAGTDWVYVLAPWGLQLELLSYPHGKGPADSPARRLWNPTRPEVWPA